MTGFISKWLVLGPISNTSYQSLPHSPTDGHPLSGDIINDIDSSTFSPLAVTASLDASPQDKTTVLYHSDIFAKGSYAWRELEFSKNINWNNSESVGNNIHQGLDEAFRDKHHALAFFLIYIHAPDQRNTKLLVRSDDSLRVWLNGMEMPGLKFAGERELGNEESAEDVTLVKGWNILLAAVAETHVEWGFSARFADDADLQFATGTPYQETALLPGKQIKRYLDEISDNHAVFEKDQVLTHDQLNSITDYLNDQNRLTRVGLAGVGIFCGLRALLKGSVVTLTKGSGITTDGDLLYFRDDVDFAYFRTYDKTKPAYAPFYGNADFSQPMIPVYELVSKPKPQDSVLPLAQFKTETGKEPGSMVAVLLMESSVTDRDICSSTDCDNLGQDAVNITRLLLVSRSDAESLAASLPKPALKAKDFPRMKIGRIQHKDALADTASFAVAYLKACEKSLSAITECLPILPKLKPQLTAELFGGNPSAGWQQKLKNILADFRADRNGIQYCHDFFKDLAETWNAMRDALLDDGSLPCTDPKAFPKHLLLGALSGPESLRTGFYPIGSMSSPHLEHARFLARKLHVLINTFTHPAKLSAPAVSITPSRTETVSLEERAIPYYYAAGKQWNVLHAWNWRLEKRGDTGQLAGYRAKEMDADTPRDDAMQYCLGEYDFFRIEGHLGQQVETVKAQLEDSVSGNASLPFAVRAILLNSKRDNIRIKPPFRFGDLHRIHHLLRADVASQIQDTHAFSGILKKRFEDAVKDEEIPSKLPDTDTGFSVIDKASGAHQKINSAKEAAIGADGRSGPLNARRYADYRKTSTQWQGKLDDALEETLRSRSDLGELVRMDAASPMDAIGASKHHIWLGWLDNLIKARDDQEDEKLLLSGFYEHHPQLEHLGGVPRGGTFVLVYDDKGKVVADLALPYWCDDPDEKLAEEPELPELVLPKLPPFVDIRPIKVRTPINKVMDKTILKNLDDFKKEMQPKLDDINRELRTPEKTFELFNTAVDVVGKFMGPRGTEAIQNSASNPKETGDLKLDRGLRDIAYLKDRTNLLIDKMAQPDLPLTEQANLERQLKETQDSLSSSIKEATQYMIDAKVDTSTGSSAASAVAVLASGMSSMGGSQLSKLTADLGAMNSGLEGASQKALINTMLKVGSFKIGG